MILPGNVVCFPFRHDYFQLTSMCSASQPSSLAILEAILRAKHFLPSNELPPYPLPKDAISLLSGMCVTRVWDGLHGQLFTGGSVRNKKG